MADQTPTLPHTMLVGREGIYFTGEDSLRITSLSASGSVVVTTSGRFLPVDRARPEPFAHPHTPNSDRTAATSDAVLGEGWLQNLTVVATSGALAAGTVFVRVDVIRGRGAAATVVATLAQGFVGGQQRLVYPGGSFGLDTGPSGSLRVVLGSDPGANTEVVETVPIGALWRLRALRVELVTDATAANREVSITFDDGADVFFEIAAGLNQAASLTRQYTFAAVGVRGAAATATSLIVPIPDLFLSSAFRIQTVTTNRQAGDNYGAPVLLVEETFTAA